MNKVRREKLSKIKINLEFSLEQLKSIQSDEEEAYYSMPESIRDSERGLNAEDAVESLNEAVDYLEQSIEYINQAKE